MAFQTDHVLGGKVTEVTLKRLVVEVGAFMLLEAVFMFGGEAAPLALEGLVSCVEDTVHL